MPAAVALAVPLTQVALLALAVQVMIMPEAQVELP
jgi:hypothetical protein